MTTEHEEPLLQRSESRDWRQDEVQAHKPTWNMFDYQSAPLAGQDKKTYKIMQKKKTNKHKQNNKKHWATSWHQLDKNERRGELVGELGIVTSVLGREKSPPPTYTHASTSVTSCSCCSGTVQTHLDFSYSILTPTLHLPPNTQQFFPTVLAFQLTKHLTHWWWRTVRHHMHKGPILQKKPINK